MNQYYVTTHHIIKKVFCKLDCLQNTFISISVEINGLTATGSGKLAVKLYFPNFDLFNVFKLHNHMVILGCQHKPFNHCQCICRFICDKSKISLKLTMATPSQHGLHNSFVRGQALQPCRLALSFIATSASSTVAKISTAIRIVIYVSPEGMRTYNTVKVFSTLYNSFTSVSPT